MKKKIIAASLACSLLLSALLPLAPVVSAVTASDPYSCLIAENDIPLHLLYDEEAPYGNEDAYATNNSGDPSYVSSDDDGWERWSIPLGNGYFGVNAFGRTETERLQITEKTLSNPYKVSDSVGVAYDGLNNFSETYIDFGHKNSDVTNYSRALDLKTAISTVEYTYNGVKYTREYFTSYPDKAIVIRLTADTAGALDFNLRPTVPYEQDYMRQEGDNGGKSGTVNVSLLDNDNGYGEICLKGNMQYYDIDFEACYRVMIEGGTISKDGVPNQSEENRNVGDEMLKVSGATSALILVTLGTNYELNSNVFTSATQDKIPDTNKSAHDKVTEEMQAILSRNEGKNIEDTYADIREAHVNDYSELFGRVSLDIATDEADYTRTTDELLSNYQAGNGGTYLEVLYFQYGRYLLIASSRSGALPANLQGTWNRYNNSPWSAGYWHNINEQMNYWPAFSTNLAETFESYVEYNQAYMQAAKNNASNIINSQYKDQAGKDGGNGWCLGNGWAYSIGGNDSAGNLGFMTELFWDYYQYTMDEELLEETVYPTLADAARFITKIMIVDEDGHYLVKNSDSPEQYYSGSGSGAWYYTQGTTYAQTFAYLNNYHTLLAAEILGKTGADDSILTTIAEQLDKYDPFLVGLSGQLKEFREEEYYSEPVSALEIAEETVESTTLVWNNASGAVKYNIYKAVEDAATYTYVGTTTANIYVVASDKGEENARTTFCVTAVSADGTESDRKLVYRNPHDPAEIENASLIALESGKLQAVIQASGDVEQYTFYRKASGSASYTEIANSEYPVIIYDGVYDAESSYAVSVTCAYTGKTSELFEFDGIGDASLSNFGYTDNIFENADGTYKKFTGDTSMISPTSDSNKWYYGYENLTDGSFNGSLGRFALAAGKKYDMVATIDLDGVYLLDAMKIYDFVNSGEITRTGNCTLEVYHDGKWTKVTGFTDVKLDEETGTGHYGNICTTWNIADTSGTVIAEKLRLTFEHVEADKGISIYEIVCSGTKIASANATVDNIFKNADGTYKKFTGDDSKCHTSAYAYDKLTDGDTHYATGRFSLKAGETTMEATMDLGGIYILDTLRINDFRNANDPARADDCKVEVYINGTWTTVLSGKSFDDERSGGWISWDLGGVRAEKIRLTFANTTDATKYPVSINEIECSGRRSPEKSDSNALAGLTSDKLTLDNATAHPSTSVKNISNAFDGDTGTRFAVLNGTGAYSLTMELGESTPLYTLRIYDFRDGNDKINGALATRSDETTVELRVDGKWYTFIDKQPMTVEKAYTDFYLGGVNADAIKITFNHTKAFDNESSPTARASIYEISCTTSSQSLDRSGALEALKNLDDLIENSSKDIFLAGASAYSKKARANLGSLTITEDGYNSMVSALAKWNSVFEGDTEYAFMVSGEDGVPTFYESVNATADGTKLQNVLNTLSASSTVTLLSDITWNSGTVDWNGTSSPMAGKTLEFDFNGMTVTLGTSTGSGTGSWLMHRCGMTAHYYSSRPGGKLISKNNKLVAFGQGSTSPVTVGAYEVDGKTISGDNLTIENLQLCDPWSGCTFTVDGGTYTHSADATGSMINVRSGSITIKNATLISDNSAPVINITDTAYATTTLENCMFVSTVDKNLIGGKDLSVGIVIKGGSFYGYTLNKYGASYTISDEPRFTAVDSALTSLTAARVREKKSELAPTASAVRYCIVRTASDASEVTWDYLNGNTLVEMWRVGEMPQNDDTRDIDGTDYYYQFKATDCVAKETKMTVAMEIASRSSKVLGNLTLYSDITFNLYFLKDGKISGITYDGKTTEFGSDCEVEIDGKTYYAYSISNMAPKDLYSSFTLDVVLEGESGVYRVKTSLAKYASSVLRGAADTEEGNAAKKLVLSLLDYVRETAVAFGGADEQHAGISAIDSLLEAYEYSRTEWSNTGNAQVPNKGNIVAGSLELGSAPGFAFTLAESYKDRDSVTLTVNGSQMTCEVLKRADSGNPYVLINRIHVSNYRDVIHISLDGHEFDYSFDAYMLGFDGVIPGYANALYTYSLAAENYLAATEEGE